MHEIYMLAVLFNVSRRPSTELTRQQRLRDEQAFYERHSGDRGRRFKGLARFAPAVPVALTAFAAMMGLTHLLAR
ncbi:MAG TPA: hypothetical protein VH704_10630 [Casimicrobiaceae bacterium]|jgi:hypothetical protein|nr:hypothetical protein [Casimicrobiaceae bacterium]